MVESSGREGAVRMTVDGLIPLDNQKHNLAFSLLVDRQNKIIDQITKNLSAPLTDVLIPARDHLPDLVAAQMGIPLALSGKVKAMLEGVSSLGVKSELLATGRLMADTFELHSSHDLIASSLRAIEATAPFLPEEDVSICRERILPELRDGKSTFSFDRIMVIIGLLLTLLSILLSRLPDPQLDKIIEQNSIIAEQNDRLIELSEQQVELERSSAEHAQNIENAIKGLAGAFNALAEEIEPFIDQSDNIGELLKDMGDSDDAE